MDKTRAIAIEEHNGKTYVAVRDYRKMGEGAETLLAELMRIKAEGDYKPLKALIDRYGIYFDPKLRDQVVERYKRLNPPVYWAGINPDLRSGFDKNGRVTSVSISYRCDYVAQ